MSKKKATMTLKDFHGGSIPSDLPLPSAPGVVVRPSERSNTDRHTSWGNPMGRPDHRLRPGSAGTLRTFDETTPFLNHNSHIGRNFDEDERKPLDGISGPRRIVSDDSFHGSARIVEPKLDYSGHGKSVSTLGKQNLNGLVTTNYTSVTPSVGLNHQNTNAPRKEIVSGSSPNAWGMRKDAVVVKEPSHALSYGIDASVKLAHASALEKVSSGRWHSKQPSTSHPDVERTHRTEASSELYTNEKAVLNKNTYNSLVVGEGSSSIDNGIRYSEPTRPSVHVVANEKPVSGCFNGPQLPHVTLQSRGSEAPSSDGSERPKLKLLPRSKPLDNVELPVDYNQVKISGSCKVMKPLDNVELPVDYNQGYQNSPVRAEILGVSLGKDDLKAGFVGSENENTIIERPKLNLKPRSEPLEHFDGKRNTLFGGARPRELVLKERGIDNASAITEDFSQPSNWAKQDNNLKVERRSVVGTTVEYTEKTIEVQRRNWRGSENWRNKKEPEKQHNNNTQMQPEKRPSSPETWRRKHVEEPEASSGVRNVKAASAVELAQAFSRSISDPPIADSGGQRGIPNRQVPFSRLMEPTRG